VLISGHAVSGSVLIGLLRGLDLTAGIEQTGPNAIYMMNTGVQLLFQDPASGLFELAGTNINHPADGMSARRAPPNPADTKPSAGRGPRRSG
jgi:hypothetical protein